MNKNTALRAIFFALITILVACGGGGGGGGGQNVAGAPTQPPPPTAPDTPQVDGGMGGTGGVSGAVQDFGSIFVNDIEMITDTASISVEGNTASEGALAAGQQVAIIGDLDTRIAETVDYRANVKGTVDSISSRDIDLGEASLNVLGQMVRTSAATRYVNGGLGGLAVGQILEVSGFMSSDGEILATYIEVHDSLDMFKVVGVVSANGSGGFRLNQLQVDSSQALLQGFGDTVLADGLRVEVRAQRSAFTSGSVVAEAIELLEQRSFDEGAELDMKGLSIALAAVKALCSCSSE